MIKIANYNAFLKSKLKWCPAINACTNLTKIFKRGGGGVEEDPMPIL